MEVSSKKQFAVDHPSFQDMMNKCVSPALKIGYIDSMVDCPKQCRLTDVKCGEEGAIRRQLPQFSGHAS
jgi:hypothetical protein